ncbi:DUF2726 domain-containing protein [Rhodothermus bifroesti]|uniref:DUF2726 domain-containing protein n=1 Tax=Rhodothermus bifroesti TaxID=2823335 RepID=UPI000CB1F1C5|nr:DUF2726 domain-containing protein [Rhodothermus bifroesti]GBD01114.1 hypothetical protein HRbin18_00834 [bacterium HR18]
MPPPADVEALYRYLQAQAWEPALEVLYQNRMSLAIDPLLQQATQVLLNALRAYVNSVPKEVLEKLFLLHTGQLFRLPEDFFADVVVALVERHADRPEVAQAYARWLPEHPLCAPYMTPMHTEPVWEAWDGFAVKRYVPTRCLTPPSLFRSRQEAVFFQAVREVFLTYLVYPNVALSCLLDYEQLADALTEAERSYVFRAQVDCVVFDPDQDYRPCFCFELDSPLHAAPERQARDQTKARILGLAGLVLYRIRPPATPPDRQAYVRLLRRLLAQATPDKP